eukprot:scaffold2263_cov391-Prasinococcus_capsulatus_cf.AAC.9
MEDSELDAALNLEQEHRAEGFEDGLRHVGDHLPDRAKSAGVRLTRFVCEHAQSGTGNRRGSSRRRPSDTARDGSLEKKWATTLAGYWPGVVRGRPRPSVRKGIGNRRSTHAQASASLVV